MLISRTREGNIAVFYSNKVSITKLHNNITNIHISYTQNIMSHQQYSNNNQQQRSSRFQSPELYSITKGIVTRIEPYGCFVKLQDSPISGLVHISQLYSTKVENVTDVVSLDDEVYVKVMDVQVETVEDAESGRTRQRHKVKLSMKYVHQE